MTASATVEDGANLRRALGDFAGGLHLAVMTGPFLGMIVSGRKTVESRFHRQRRAPLFTAKPGDVVVFRQSGRPASVAAILGDTHYLDIAETGIGRIRTAWAASIGCDDDDFWAARANARWVSLLQLDSVFPIPPQTLRKRDRNAWVSYPCPQLDLFSEA